MERETAMSGKTRAGRPRIRRLGVLTGGGDVPGLNAAIKAIVYRADPLGIEVVGLRAGWEGITFLDRSQPKEALIFREDDERTWDSGYLMPLNRRNTRAIDRVGGTILQSTRSNPANVRVEELPAHLRGSGVGHGPDDRLDLTSEVLANIEFLELDGVIVIGGDGTLGIAAGISARGVPIWAIPKTMDNDVPGTEYCIGFQTAIDRASEYIDRVRSTAASHRQTVLFRLFGRDAGFTALETAIAPWADRVLIPEVPADLDRLAELVVNDRRNPSRYSVVLLSEGADLGIPIPDSEPPDAYGHRRRANVAEVLAKELASRVRGVRFLPIDLTYILRSGVPDVLDKRMAIVFSNMIMTRIEAGQPGVLAAYQSGHFVYTDIPGRDLPSRHVDHQTYNAARYRPSFEQMTGPYRSQRPARSAA
jgi:6-phosphofructokinase 1